MCGMFLMDMFYSNRDIISRVWAEGWLRDEHVPHYSVSARSSLQVGLGPIIDLVNTALSYLVTVISEVPSWVPQLR
jgi:hypothetical protein